MIKDIFNSTDNFEFEIINKIDINEDSFKGEFKKFYELVKNNNWEEVHFEFNHFKFDEEYFGTKCNIWLIGY